MLRFLIPALTVLSIALGVGGLMVVSPAPVAIEDTVVLLSQGSGHGSGVVIDAERGLILTAAHVADHADDDEKNPMWMKAGGCKTTVHVLWIAAENDIALLQTDTNGCKLTAAKLRTAPLHLGEAVKAVGFPIWLGSVTTSGHVVSAETHTPGDEPGEALVVHDAVIAPGNSGGALFDAYGNLVGINTAMSNFAMGLVRYPSGHYLAIPVSTICTLLVCS